MESIDPSGLSIWRIAFRVAGAGIRHGKRISEGAALRIYKAGGDVVTKTAAEARRLAAKASQNAGGGGSCSAVESHNGGANHVHALDASKRHLGNAGHIFIDSALEALLEIGGELSDPNHDGTPFNEGDAWEWLNPLPVEIPIPRMSVGDFEHV